MRSFVIAMILWISWFWLLPPPHVAAESITMGYFELPPHMYRSTTNGRPEGACIAYIEKIAAAMGVDVCWEGPLPFSRLMFAMEKRTTLDGTPLMSITAARQAFMVYSRHPFYLARPNLIVRQDNPLERITSGEDIRGMVVGQFEKAADSAFITKHLALLKMERVSTGRLLIEQQLKKLIAGRLDAIHTLDEYTLLYQARCMKRDQQIKIRFLPEPVWPFYTAFRKTERGRQLAVRFDAAFRASGFTPDAYTRLIQGEFDRLAAE